MNNQKRTKPNNDPKQMYLARLTTIQATLAEKLADIERAIKIADLDRIDWGDVGDLGQVLEALRQLPGVRVVR